MKRNKLVILMSCMLATSIILGGCSKEKTIVIDTEVQYDKNVGVNVTEETINVKVDDDQMYIPKFFKDDKIYGTFGLSGGNFLKEGTVEYPVMGVFKENLYMLNNEGELSPSNIQPASYIWGADSHGVERAWDAYVTYDEVYYYDNRTGEKRVIGEFSNEYKREGNRFECTQLIEGNRDYAYIMKCDESSNGVGEDKLLELQIINLKDDSKYTYKGDNISLLDEIVYSKLTEEFYAVDWTGKLYKLELSGDEVKFVNDGDIDYRGIHHIGPSGVSINGEGEIIILNKWGDFETLAVIYNPKTKACSYIGKDREEEIFVEEIFPETNKVVVRKKNENKQVDLFVGELKGDSLKIYTKVNNTPKDTERSLYSGAIINEEGNKILVGTHIYTPTDNNVTNSRYVYNIITIE